MDGIRAPDSGKVGARFVERLDFFFRAVSSERKRRARVNGACFRLSRALGVYSAPRCFLVYLDCDA